MQVYELVCYFYVTTLLGFIVYLVRGSHKDTLYFVNLLQDEHHRALAAIASVAETAIETVKASTLAEREQVRAQRQVNDVQVNQMRDIIKKQATMISETPKSPEKVRLDDGTEVTADEYEWGIGV